MTTNKMPQCKAKLSYGGAWVVGRKRCSKRAAGEEGLCRTHLNQLQRREEERNK